MSVYGSSSRKWTSSFVPKYIRNGEGGGGGGGSAAGVGSGGGGLHGPYRSNGANIGIRSREHSEDEDELEEGEEEVDGLLGIHGINDDIKVNMISSSSDIGDSFGGGGSSTSTIGKRQARKSVLESIQLRDSEDDVLLDDEPPEDIALQGEMGRNEEEEEDNSDEERQIGMRPFIPPDFLPNGGGGGGGGGDRYGYVDADGDLYVNPNTNNTNTQSIPNISLHDTSSIKFDPIWANVYLAFVSMVLATSLMIWFTTSIPKSAPLGDTIYTIIKSSWSLLFIYTLIAITISIAWVYVIRRYASFSVYSLVVIVPMGLLALTLYPFIMSFSNNTNGPSQRSAMRWTSFVPLVLGILWCYMLYKGRHALTRSLGIINLSCSILNENKPLMLLSAGIIFIFTIISILWLNLFARLFLQGHTIIDHGKTTWVLDPKSWLLGACYILMYLWTWGVISGIHRTAISATVAQWYFHRHEPYSIASSSTLRIVQASLQYSLTTQFGTICYSSLLVLLARLPILLLPSRLSSGFQMIIYTLISRTSILSLTSPLALTNATINSQNLIDSAHSMTSIIYAYDDSNKTTSTNNAPHRKNNRIKRSWLPYKLSKILLTACRGLTALFMGFGAWIHTASSPAHGSLYGYIVGLLASFIGWVIIGATEGTLSMIVDATFVCFALDNYSSKGGHCVEADRQFGGH